MNKLLIFFSILLFPIFLFSQDNWQRIGGEKFHFTTDFHSLVQYTMDTIASGKEPVLLHTWVGVPEVDSHPVISYKASISNYPNNFINSDSSFLLIEGFLNSAALELLESPGLELLTSSLIFKDGYPGKVFQIREKETNALMEMHCFLIENHYLEMITISRTNNWFSHQKNRFFESMSLIGHEENKADYGIPVIKVDSYSINFPATPKVNNSFVAREDGYVNMKMQILEQDPRSGIAAFMASEGKYPKDFTVEDGGMDAFYQDAMNGSIRSMNGKLISKEKIELKDKKGIEFYASISEGAGKSLFRCFYENGTMYMYGVLFTEGELNAEGKKFLDSFEIVGE